MADFTRQIKAPEIRSRVEDFRKKHRTSVLTLLFTDLVGSTHFKQVRGDTEAIALLRGQDELVRELLHGYPEARELSTAGDSFFCVFVRPSEAVAFALRLQASMRVASGPKESPLQVRVGIHLGEVVVEEDATRGSILDLYGLQVDTAARITGLAGGNQILCSRSVLDNARQVLKGRELENVGSLAWLSHGPYLLKGVEDPVEVCEVGEEGYGVLERPPASEKARPAELPEEELGWRPATDTRIPGTDWALEHKLGEGGFGEVWLARHRTTKEERVFKFCFVKEKVRALRRELALFRLIRKTIGEHPGIVSLHEVHLEEAPYYLGMQYVPGPNLREWLLAEGRLQRLSTPAKLDLAAQIADALEAAHRAGVIHQDLKPQNILVEATAPLLPSGAPKVKLSDFGVGRVGGQEFLKQLALTGGGASLLQSATTGSGAGTYLYMAPERVEGKGATPLSDQYSLGVVLFQLMAGDLNRALGADWERDVREPLIRGDLRRVLSGKPESRFASAAELAQRLRRWPTRRRLRLVKQVGAVLGLLLVIGIGLFALLKTRPEDDSREPASTRQEVDPAVVELSYLRGEAALLAGGASEARVHFESVRAVSEASWAAKAELRLAELALQRRELQQARRRGHDELRLDLLEQVLNFREGLPVRFPPWPEGAATPWYSLFWTRERDCRILVDADSQRAVWEEFGMLLPFLVLEPEWDARKAQASAESEKGSILSVRELEALLADSTHRVPAIREFATRRLEQVAEEMRVTLQRLSQNPDFAHAAEAADWAER